MTELLLVEPLGSGSTSVTFSLTLSAGREEHSAQPKKILEINMNQMKTKYVSSAGGDDDNDDVDGNDGDDNEEEDDEQSGTQLPVDKDDIRNDRADNDRQDCDNLVDNHQMMTAEMVSTMK